MRDPSGAGRQDNRLPAMVAALLLVLLTACGGTSAGAGSVSTGTASEATVVAATTGVASASPASATTTAATTTGAIATSSRTASSSSSAVTTAPPVAKLSAALSAASRLATSTATGSAGGGPVAEKLVFTGVVAGTVNSSPAPGECGKRDIAPLGTVLHVFRFSDIVAVVGGVTIDMGLQISDYTGPKPYNSGTNAITLAVNNHNSGASYLNSDSPVVVVVAPDEASGTIDGDFADLFGGPNAKGHVSGSWRCR